MRTLSSQGTLFIVAAPSGAGKTSLVNALVESLDHITLSISYTTRPRRSSEQEGVHYHFVDQTTFEQMLQENAFLEHAKVFNHYYGTSRQWVEEQLQKGNDVILEIDWQGAVQVRQQMPNCLSIFILPPSRQILAERLRKRGQDAPETITNRLREASNEIAHYGEFDYLIVNDEFQCALAELSAIICSSRLKLARQRQKHQDLLAELLKKE